MLQYIDRYFDLAVQCLEVEVVLDVTAFALSALKHATAVVLHVLDRAAIALCLVLSTLLGPTGGGERGDCEDVSHQQQGVSPQQEQSALLDLVGQKKTALVGGANRMLQIVYELHCHLSGRIPPSTMELLEKAMTLLFVHSSHFSLLPTPTPINAPTSTCPSVEEGKGGGDVALTAQLATVGVAPAFGLTATSEAASGSASSSTSTSVTVDVAAAVTPAPSPSAIRSLCAAKWGGAPKLPKTELGKRSKGYFTLATCTSTERAATGSVTVSGSSFETTGTANANPSAVGVSAKDRAAVEAALQAIILLIVSNCSKRPLDDDVVEVEGEGGRDGRVNKLMKTT